MPKVVVELLHSTLALPLLDKESTDDCKEQMCGGRLLCYHPAIPLLPVWSDLGGNTDLPTGGFSICWSLQGQKDLRWWGDGDPFFYSYAAGRGSLPARSWSLWTDKLPSGQNWWRHTSCLPGTGHAEDTMWGLAGRLAGKHRSSLTRTFINLHHNKSNLKLKNGGSP